MLAAVAGHNPPILSGVRPSPVIMAITKIKHVLCKDKVTGRGLPQLTDQQTVLLGEGCIV